MAKRWFTNGITEQFIEESVCPNGFHLGRKPVSAETRKKHSVNNGSHKMSAEQRRLKAEKISKTKQARTPEEIQAELDKAKQTFLAHYGVEHPMYLDEVKNKQKQNCLEKYGVDNPAKNQAVKDKIAATNLERYGATCVFASEEIKDKIKQTNLDKYGVDNYQKTAEARERAKKFYKINKEFILDRVKQIKKARYGDENYNNQFAARQTCINKFGVPHFAQTDLFHQIARKHYILKDEYFDSLPELAVYLYATFHNENIVRCPERFEYTFEGKTHYYFPDFYYNGELVEIKGDHFFTKDGVMINPFDPSQSKLYEAKHQCGLANGVEFWQQKDYQKYIDWFYAQGYKKEDFLTDEGEIPE